MKLDEVLDWKGPDAKMKRLVPMLTPDVMAQHHDAMVNIIASKLAVADIDELEAELAGKDNSEEAIKFQLEMIAKSMSKYGKASAGVNGNGHPYAQCTFQIAADWHYGATKYKLSDVHISTTYHRGVWYVRLPGHYRMTEKKVKAPVDALALMKTEIEKLLKKYPASQAGQPIKGKNEGS